MGVLRLHNSSRIDELVGGRTPVKQVINLAAPSDTLMLTHILTKKFLSTTATSDGTLSGLEKPLYMLNMITKRNTRSRSDLAECCG